MKATPTQTTLAARAWTRATTKVDRHVGACKAGGGGCKVRVTSGRNEGKADCPEVNRLIKLEDSARKAYLACGGTMPVGCP